MSEFVTRVSGESARVVAELLAGPPDPGRHARLAAAVPVHDDRLVVACDRYLEGKRCQLWGAFSIGRTDDRWAAAVWLADQIRAVVGESA